MDNFNDFDFGADGFDTVNEGNSQGDGELDNIFDDMQPSFDSQQAQQAENIFNGGSGAENNTVSKSNGTVKLAVITCAVCFIVLIVIFVIWSNLGKDDKDTSKQNVSDTQVEQVVTDNKNSTTQGSEQKQENVPTVAPVIPNNTVEKADAWVEIDLSTVGTISQPIPGYFTVTEVKTYAKLKGNENGNYLKSILYGNITSLQGTYELVIPTESASKVSVGDVISIEYSTVNIGDKKILVDIR